MDDNTIYTKYCQTWVQLLNELDDAQGKQIYCTQSVEEWGDKLYEWRKLKNAKSKKI